MANVQVEITNSDVNRALQRQLDSLTDLRPALEDIGEYLLLQTRSRFDREQTPQGRPWADISPAWKKQKQKEGRDRGILHYTLALRDLITYKVTARTLSVGSARPYAAIHQFGGQAGKGGRSTIEARPFLGLSSDDRQEIIAILRDDIAP